MQWPVLAGHRFVPVFQLQSVPCDVIELIPSPEALQPPYR
jgi:hypothetical protein